MATVNALEADVIFSGERYYSREKVSNIFKISRQTLACWAVRGEGPAFIKLGRQCLYPEKGLLAWVESKHQAHI